MLSRLKDFYARTKLGRSFRFSRQIAGGMAGTFFTLGGICKVPLQNFLFGYGAAATTAIVANIFFGLKASEHYQSSDPHSPSNAAKKAEKKISTKLIIDKLHLDDEKTKNFLTNLNIKESDIKRLEDWTIESEDNLQDILTHIYNALEFNIKKYPTSMLFGLMLTGAHFMECLLVQVYMNADVFSYAHGITPANFILSAIALLAIIQGVLEFIDVKKSFEQPPLAVMSNTIFKAYDKYLIAQQNQNEKDEQDQESTSSNSSKGLTVFPV